VYPTQNPQYPDTNPLLDVYGLLFTDSNQNELNLWGNADGSYTLGSNIGGQTVTVNHCCPVKIFMTAVSAR